MPDSTPAPATLADALSDRYRLVRELGRDGMATVYLAEDVRHKRQVAIKVLHPELSAVIGAERFLKEIELTANLQHPHILPLFDSGSAAGQLYYVMPFIDGETLRGRLDREQQLPVADAVRIAREVADALGHAHGRGIVHRDIKPENILLQGGHALVADFGIALALQQAGGVRMTQTGMSLGTPQYMAPEQAMGERVVDARADIYALGAVTYEMLVGEPPFVGPNSQAIVAKMMSERPMPLRIVRDTIPTDVESAVMTALAKLPADRFADVAQFGDALLHTGERTRAPERHASTSGAPTASRWPKLLAAGALLSVGLIAGALARDRLAGGVGDTVVMAAASGLVEMDFETGPPLDGDWVSISRDGRAVVAEGRDSLGRKALVLRELAHTQPRFLAVADEPSAPTISPNGRWIAYVSSSDYTIFKIPVDGGPSVRLGKGNYLTWIDDDSIAFFRSSDFSLSMMSANGGTAHVIAPRDSARELHAFSPFGIPGHRVVLFCSYTGSAERSRIDAVDLETRKRTTVLEGACEAHYEATGHLLFVRGDALYAIGFDVDHLKTIGTPVLVLGDLHADASSPDRGFDISATGTIVYRRASAWQWPRQMVFRSRDGRVEPIMTRTGAFSEPRLSPDGTSILFTSQMAHRELWLADVAKHAASPLLKGDGDVFDAIWYSDSRSFAYSREVQGAYTLYRSSVDGAVKDARLFGDRYDKWPSAVSADGQTIWFTSFNADEYVASFSLGQAAGKPLFADSAWGRRAVVSPDGRWVAVESHGGSGSTNVVIVAADGRGSVHRVSLDGGQEACWTRDGRELIYRAGTAIMSATVDLRSGDASAPVLLFRAPLAPVSDFKTRSYDVSADGSRFVMVEPLPGAPPLNVVVVNWVEELKRKMAAAK